ncbi:hypothetical protein DFH94DRAFT_684975 [Russula ochroleuca]|uniref:Uncharacterized protein n=1 Tax=Russula ochroleuca TaxID=152965 RepID=A0A9P5MQT3_9AGAM|nr:hypothetical protein DFH94DRAFT_684975 [Russula ochroleuca]
MIILCRFTGFPRGFHSFTSMGRWLYESSELSKRFKYSTYFLLRKCLSYALITPPRRRGGARNTQYILRKTVAAPARNCPIAIISGRQGLLTPDLTKVPRRGACTYVPTRVRVPNSASHPSLSQRTHLSTSFPLLYRSQFPPVAYRGQAQRIIDAWMSKSIQAAGEAENGEAGVKRGGRSVRKRKHITALARATLGDVRRVRPVGVRMDRLWTGDYSSYHRGKKKQQCDVHAVPAAAVATDIKLEYPRALAKATARGRVARVGWGNVTGGSGEHLWLFPRRSSALADWKHSMKERGETWTDKWTEQHNTHEGVDRSLEGGLWQWPPRFIALPRKISRPFYLCGLMAHPTGIYQPAGPRILSMLRLVPDSDRKWLTAMPIRSCFAQLYALILLFLLPNHAHLFVPAAMLATAPLLATSKGNHTLLATPSET